MNEWWQGIVPLEVRLECGGETHRLRWAEGHLTALDHADPEGERALSALGAERCACVEALDLWERHRRDPAVLVLGPRGTNDGRPREMAGRQRVPRTATVVKAAVAIRGMPMVQREPVMQLAHLLSLGLGRRLASTVLAEAEIPPALLDAALYGRLLAGLMAWRADAKDLELEVIAPQEEPELRLDQDGRLHARISTDWLLHVWSRELESGFGYFTLSCADGEVLTVVDGGLMRHRMRLSLL